MRIRQIFILLVALFIFIGTTPAKSQINAEQVMTIGRNVMSMEDYMLAIQYFNQAIKAKPYLADPYFYRAIAKLSLDDLQGAEEDCNIAIEKNRFKTEAYKVRGFVRQLMGKDSLAIEDYNIGLGYNPTDRNFLFYKAVALTELKKFAEADTTLSVLLSHYPKFEDGFTAKSRLALETGDTIKAIENIEISIKLNKSRIDPYLVLAQIRWKQKEWNQAEEALDAAIKLRPDIADLYVNRAFIKYNLDDFYGSMGDYNYALELEPLNTSALFNRGLLRYEVKDLNRSEEDFSKVLTIDPDNFHALFNRGLVRLELDKNQEALEDFEKIAGKFPKFYPVYYAMGEAKRNQGDMKNAMKYVHYADALVEKYVENPELNKLDRPAIAASESNDSRNGSIDFNESETEVMERFNRLVTVTDIADQQLSYNEKIKGRVQDRDVSVVPESLFVVSFEEGSGSLQTVSNYYRELDDLNNQNLISDKLYLTQDINNNTNENLFNRLLTIVSNNKTRNDRGLSRPIDYVSTGVALTMLKNYPDAISALDAAISLDPSLATSYMERGFAKYKYASSQAKMATDNSSQEAYFDEVIYAGLLQEALEDFNKALAINPRLVYAWFNMGNIFMEAKDFKSALDCYNKAIMVFPDFGQAYFNRGLAYLQTGNKRLAFDDLSKAGELGVLSSYNLLKRMK